MQEITIELSEDRASLLENIAEEEYDGDLEKTVYNLLNRGFKYEDLEFELQRKKERIQNLQRQINKKDTDYTPGIKQQRSKDNSNLPFFIQWLL